MNRWPYKDNMFYDSATDRVMLHTPEEDYYYFNRQEPLGVGGMGYVLRGWSFKDNRQVAIKRVHNKYADIPEIRNRAKNESKLTFRHANLIEMLGIVESKTGKGPIFIISNFVKGVNVDSFIKSHLSHLPDEEREKRIINMMLPVLDALKYIHDSSIFHLDVKPSNIMVENGRSVRLMDLGIALTRKINVSLPSGTHSGEHTGTGLMGTPRYAAPEQFGIPGFGEISNRSDIYEYGITLYELITDKNPFKGLTLSESIEKHKTMLLPRHESISPRVLEVLRKATSPLSSERYADVESLSAALRESLIESIQEGKFKKILKKIGL